MDGRMDMRMVNVITLLLMQCH